MSLSAPKGGDESAVYRMIADLSERGIIHAFPEQGSRAYGLADPPHHPMVCQKCGRVAEIPADALLVKINGLDVAEFQLADAGHTVLGRCPACSDG